MDANIIVALIGLVGSLCGTLVGYYAAAKLTEYRIAQLEKKVDSISDKVDTIHNLNSHNNLQDERIRQNTEDIKRIFSILDKGDAL